LFSIVTTNRVAAKGGCRIDAGSVTLHPNFMSLMSSW